MTEGLTIEQVTVAGAFLLGVGYAILGALALVEKTRPIAKELTRTFFSATVIAAVLIVAATTRPIGITVLVIFISLRVGYEVGHVRMGSGTPAWATACLALVMCLVSMHVEVFAWAMAGVWPLLLIRIRTGASKAGTAGLMDILVFPLIPMALMSYGGGSPDMLVAVAGSYALVEIFDSCALLSGKLFGKRKAFPVLSPRKTIEGLIGALIGLCVLTAIGAAVLGLWVPGYVAAAVLISVLAVAGDLAASRLKRMAGVKDYPTVLKHQGGLLDSLDSWIAASAGLVAVYFVMTLL